MKRLWILNHHSGLEGDRHYELAKEMAASGMEVVVFLSAFDHQTETYIFEKTVTIRKVEKGVSYVWLRTTPAYHGNGTARILNMISYYCLMRKYENVFYEKFQAPDAVIGSSVHPFVWENAWHIAQKNKIPFICEIRDFWPLSFTEIYGWSRFHPACLLFSLLERRAYRRADAIVTSMEFGCRYLEQFPCVNQERIFWIPNGYHTAEIDRVLQDESVKLPKELDQYLMDHWCAVYTGSFVDSERLFDMLNVAAYMQEHGMEEVNFAFIGDGHLRPELEAEVKREGLKNVRIFPRIEKSQVAVALSKAKVCIAALKDDRVLNDLGLSLNKLNDYLYSGNPTVFACNSVNVVGESAGGIVVPCGDTKAYAEVLMKIYHMPEKQRRDMGENGRRTIRETYNYTLLAKKYMDILKKCTEKSTPGEKERP